MITIHYRRPEYPRPVIVSSFLTIEEFDAWVVALLSDIVIVRWSKQ